jgi:hypothetical protein
MVMRRRPPAPGVNILLGAGINMNLNSYLVNGSGFECFLAEWRLLAAG